MNGEKKFFKLILGLGNLDLEVIKRITSIYALCGCDMFDFAPDESVIETIFSAIKSLNLDPKDFKMCVSTAIEGDKHAKKAFIDPLKCRKCGKCAKKCPQNAIKVFIVDQKKCIGCQKCSCKYGAITFRHKSVSPKMVLELVEKYDLDMIELHISTKKTKEIFETLKYFCKNTKAKIGVCVGRQYFSDEKLNSLIKKISAMVLDIKSEKIIVQADGTAISGGKDDYASTLQAVATAQILQNQDCELILSGGTNSFTIELAEKCNLIYKGVAVGSFARKLIESEINFDDFCSNRKIFEAALSKAKLLVEKVKG